jgi:hypothetical protein
VSLATLTVVFHALALVFILRELDQLYFNLTYQPSWRVIDSLGSCVQELILIRL